MTLKYFSQCEPALMYDSVQVLAVGLGALYQNNITIDRPNISCKNEVPWQGGSSLMKFINSVCTHDKF